MSMDRICKCKIMYPLTATRNRTNTQLISTKKFSKLIRKALKVTIYTGE